MTESTTESMPGAGSGALVFNHIPKTAGTALAEGLIETLRPTRIVRGVDGVVLGDLGRLGSVHPRLRGTVITSPDRIDADAQFVTGHITPATTMAGLPSARHLTVLREPRTRILSLWMFSRTRPARESRRWGAYGAPIRLARLPLADYLAAPAAAIGVDNMITRFLAWPHRLAPADGFIDPSHDDELLAAAHERLGRYAHVGLVEDPRMSERLSAFLGIALAVPRLNETGAGWAATPDVVAEVAAADDLLRARTRLDGRLWSLVVARELPDESPEELAEQTFARAVERYAALGRTGSHRPWSHLVSRAMARI
jgi:hypothetical protein